MNLYKPVKNNKLYVLLFSIAHLPKDDKNIRHELAQMVKNDKLYVLLFSTAYLPNCARNL